LGLQIRDFLIHTTECVATLQFSGSLSRLIEWIDFLLLKFDIFPIIPIFDKLKEFSRHNQLLALSFLLSCFSSHLVTEPVLEFALTASNLQIVIDSLNSDEEIDQKSGICFLQTLFLATSDFSRLLPPQRNEQTDVLSILPSSWLLSIEGSSGIESYEEDAISRLELFGNVRPIGDNDDVFGAVVGVLRRFGKISVNVCLCLTKLITIFVSLAPDLICRELTEGYAVAVGEFESVLEFGVPEEKCKDCGELRAAILTEFGKEIHATFVASEKMKRIASILS
jgi:hypothetical protein